jgi:hypothetical protein
MPGNFCRLVRPALIAGLGVTYLEDIVLDSGNAGGEEDDSEESDTTETGSLDAKSEKRLRGDASDLGLVVVLRAVLALVRGPLGSLRRHLGYRGVSERTGGSMAANASVD